MRLGEWLNSVTDAQDGRDHLVRDDELEKAGPSAQCVAACGYVIVPAPLITPPTGRCQQCMGISKDRSPKVSGWRALTARLRRTDGGRHVQ